MKQLQCCICLGDIQEQQTIYDWIKQEEIICGICKKKFERYDQTLKKEGLSIFALYRYNDFLENLLFQYKEGRDVALSPIFFHGVLKKLHDKYRHHTLVLMPSSNDKIVERGFLPLREMLTGINLPMVEPFAKTKAYKQSLQTFENRKNIKDMMILKTGVILPSTPLLLIDDVCTSGSTLLWAYELLQKHTYKIEALVLSVHPLFVESCDEKHLRTKGCLTILKHVVRNGR